MRGDTTRSDGPYSVLHASMMSVESLKIPTSMALATKVSTDEVAQFFKGEQLGTALEPKCCACHCGRCPMPRFRYSFREEAEQNQEQILYNKEKQRWVAGYPCLFPKEYQKGMQCVS